MKRFFILTICLLFICFVSFAGKLVYIPVTETNNLETLFNNNDLKIHYYCDNYVLATTDVVNVAGLIVLDEKAFGDVDVYALVNCPNDNKEEYLSGIAGSVETLYSGNHFFIMKIISSGFRPAKEHGLIKIRDIEVDLFAKRYNFPTITETDEAIVDLIAEVSTAKLMSDLQHLEDYATRRCDHANSVVAQNWIKDQFESFGLNTYVQNVIVNPWWGGSCQSGNVIATQIGTEFPNEYIICGCHFDTFAYQSTQGEPGSDDNGTGTTSVIETARILSQHDFKRSIIYCTFTAEECGLDGSNAYAQKCKNEGMNIVGYFNLDMTGWLNPSKQMKMYVLYPTSALTFADYFINVCDVYFPTVPTIRKQNHSLNAQSDHKSFNDRGYQGIWWFEDVDDDGPYIHTPNDKIGPCVNNSEQVTVFAQAMVASMAILAELDGETPPPPKYPVLDLSKTTSSVSADQGDEVEDFITVYNIGEADLTFEISSIDFYDMLTVAPLNGTIQPDDSLIITLSYLFNHIGKSDEIELEGSFKLLSNDPQHLENDIYIHALMNFIGVNELNNAGMKIYPNPANDNIFIECEHLKIENIELFDNFGRKVTSNPISQDSNLISIDISHLSAGTYFININNETAGKFIKN